MIRKVSIGTNTFTCIWLDSSSRNLRKTTWADSHEDRFIIELPYSTDGHFFEALLYKLTPHGWIELYRTEDVRGYETRNYASAEDLILDWYQTLKVGK